MRTKGQKRIAHWMVDFRRWTEKGMGRGSFDTPEKLYAYGVHMAIGVSTGVTKSWFGKDIDRDYDAETSQRLPRRNRTAEQGGRVRRCT